MKRPYKLTLTVGLSRADSRYKLGDGITSDCSFFIATEKFSELAGVLIDVNNFCKQLQLQIGMTDAEEAQLREEIERGRLG